MKLIEGVLARVAPHHCISCDAEGLLLCAACEPRLTRLPERCYRCHKLSPQGRMCPTCRHASALYAVHALVLYKDVAKELVWRLKFLGARAAAQEIAHLLAAELRLPANGVIVHAPTASGRLRQRGYDQAQLIAKALARELNLPYVPLLKRMGQQQQVGAGRQQRLAQLTDAFWVSQPEGVKGTHILLVDDVLTTGATLEAAAKVLKTAGAKRVSGIVFAQA